MSRNMSCALMGTRRATMPIRGVSGADASSESHLAAPRVRIGESLRSSPSGTTTKVSARPMPRSSKSSRTRGLTATRRSVTRASARSIPTNSVVRAGEK